MGFLLYCSRIVLLGQHGTGANHIKYLEEQQGAETDTCFSAAHNETMLAKNVCRKNVYWNKTAT